MTSCRECRSYQDCPGKKWYSEKEIRYCPHQVTWILQHLEELKCGLWPKEPLEEVNPLPSLGMLPKVGKKDGGNAHFGKACCVAADVESRLARTGRDGVILSTYYCQDYKDVTELASKMGEPVDKIGHAIENALWYVSGWRRKLTDYSQWKASRKYNKT